MAITCSKCHQAFEPDPGSPPKEGRVCPRCGAHNYEQLIEAETKMSPSVGFESFLEWDGVTMTLAAVIYAVVLSVVASLLPADNWLARGLFGATALVVLALGLTVFKSHVVDAMRWILRQRGRGIRGG